MEVTIKDNSAQVKAKIKANAERALEAAGMFVEGEAMANAPVDTGRLRDSITHKTSDDEVVIGTNVEYATYVELGTSRMGEKPFLKPAIANNLSSIKALMERELSKI